MSVDHDSIKANDLLVEGKRLHDAGNYEEAVASFDKAIEIKPKFADLWKSKGDALRWLKKYEESIASYDKAIEIDPKNALTWMNKGIVWHYLKKHDDAIASYDKATEIDPKNVDAWNYKGNALCYLSRYDDAIASYDKATEIDPEKAVAWSNKGHALLELKKYEEVIASVDKAIEIDPNQAIAWRRKAFALRKLERYDDAMMCYDEAIKIDPNDATVWKNMRITLKKLGCPEYDTRCASCDHYPWTDVFISTDHTASDDPPSWRKNEERGKYDSITGQFSVARHQYKCECECHNVPTIKKLMRFSFKRKVGGESRHVMHVEKLAVCPFCKRSEFEDTVYAHMPRHELLAEDLKATGAPEREYDFDYNKLYLVHGRNTSSRYRDVELTPCAGNHKHEWERCKCGRRICKVSFRNYFGYEIDDDLFNNDLVDKSHYSKRTRALLGLDNSYDRPAADEVPVYATMETIEKIWGKMPMYRHNPGYGGWGPSSYFTYKYQDETTRPKPLGVFDISGTPEHLRSIYLIAKKRHEKELDLEFMYEVYGIGDTTADKLLEKFGTADKVFSATAEEIAKISSISEDRARRIRKKLDNWAEMHGQEYRDKKREEPFYHSGYEGYGTKSFE